MLRLPLLIFVLVFAVSITLTQYLAYQQYNILKQKQKAELVREAAAAKDRFRNILFNDIAAANTLAIIYKQYGVPAKFDSIAQQILQTSRYAEALQITENGMVRNAYPDTRYKGTIGTNVNADPVRKVEEARAVDRKDIYFAGPRRLRFGDTGILGKVPIITANKVVAVATVLTRLPTIKKALEPEKGDKNRFAYVLLKINGKDTSSFPLSDTKPAVKSKHRDIEIKEGDWRLRVYYGEGHIADKFPYELSGLGALFSFIIGLLAYRKVQEPYKLNKVIDEKSEQLIKSERYFRTLIENSTDAIRLLDASGKVLYQTPSSEKITGYNLIERQILSTDDLIHPDDREEERRSFQAALNNPGTPIPRKLRFKHKNGSYIWIEGYCKNLLYDESVGAIVVSYSDVTQKELFEQNLKESQNLFRSAFEESAIGMGFTSIEKDSMGRWLKVNRSLCDMLGYTEDELLSRTFMQITHPEDLARDVAAQDLILQGESDTYRLEKRYVHKNGNVVWINLNVSIIRDKDKQPLYLVAQIEDITEKVESQLKFRNLVENFIVSVYIHQNGKIVYVNPRALEESGYAEEDLIGKPIEQFIYKDDLALVQKITEEREKVLIDTVRYEARFVKKDAQPIWFEIFGSRTVYQGAPALMGTMVNISERKAVYDELIRSEANLKSIFETTDVSYLLLDTDYKIIALNQQMKDMYVHVADVILIEGDNLVESIVSEKKAGAKEIYDRVIQTNKAEDYETSYLKNGRYTHFIANVKPIHDGKNIIGLCISAIDITERKNALEQLKLLNENLQNKAKELAISNAELEQFAYVASHDLQEPLRMVTSFLSQLEKKYADVLDDKAKQYIFFATDGAKRMRQLILDLLEYSRVGRSENALEDVNFNTLMEEVLPLFRRNIEETNAIVRFKDLPILNIYKTPVRQVFQNLIGNALKYHKPGVSPVVEITCIESKSTFEFSVSDNGIGIEPEYFDQIFIIFKRLHNREEYTGTGMGLAITKKIVEYMGGRIWVNSKEGEGSVFHFTIPKNLEHETDKNFADRR